MTDATARTPVPPAGASRAAPRAPVSGPRWSRPARLVAGVCLLGLVLTALATWAAARADRVTEERLLETQTRQAATVLSNAILVIEHPMSSVLALQGLAGPGQEAAGFTELFAPSVGPDQLFLSAALWQRQGGELTQLETLGVPPAREPGSAESQAFLDRALSSSTSVVDRVVVGDQVRIAYALADPDTGFVVYAERAVPADRRAPVDRDSAYADLDYAIYLGPTTDTADMTTTDVDPDDLPLEGLTYETSVPFGDTVLTLVTSPREHLGSTLSERLPWILLVGGVLLTGAVALVSLQLSRSRQRALEDTGTITELYERVDHVFAEQRTQFVSLQRALLPQVIPRIPGIEIAAEYVAGAEGVDIGGDWYSVIGLREQEFAFVVGDVSGRGIDAVAEMARARFTLRAYLLDDDPPRIALEKCSRQFDISTDGHLVTVLAGIGNSHTGEVTLANAGHPLPVLVADGHADFVQVPAGLPLGAGPGTYESVTFTMPTASTLLIYTDGLVERRGEHIDVGMQRMIATVQPVGTSALETVIAAVLASARESPSSDDIAVLALRRSPAAV